MIHQATVSCPFVIGPSATPPTHPLIRVLGMTLLAKLDFPEMAFTLYFVAYCDPDEVTHG